MHVQQTDYSVLELPISRDHVFTHSRILVLQYPTLNHNIVENFNLTMK